MSKSAVVTARLDPELLEGLDRLAIHCDRSRAWIVAKAIERYVRDESRFMAFIQEGVDALDRGDFITHEQLVMEIKARRRDGKAA